MFCLYKILHWGSKGLRRLGLLFFFCIIEKSSRQQGQAVNQNVFRMQITHENILKENLMNFKNNIERGENEAIEAKVDR